MKKILKSIKIYTTLITRAITLPVLLIVLISCSDEQTHDKRAVEGILDARSHFSEGRKALFLDGEWEFYPHQLLNPVDIRILEPDTFFKVPGLWTRLKKQDGYQEIQYATYRLRIVNHGLNRVFSIRNNEVKSAFRLFLNGEEIMTNGIVAKEKELAEPHFQPEIRSVFSEKDTIELVLQVSNHHHINGGIAESFQIGHECILQRQQLFTIGMSFLLIGSLLIMAIYHLGMFFVYRKEPSTLFFGLFVLLMSLRIFVTGEEPLLLLIPELSWDLMYKFEFGSIFIAPAFFILFFKSLFSDEVHTIIARIYVGIAIVLTLPVIFLPVNVFLHILPVYIVFLTVISISLLYWLWRAWLNKKEGAIPFFIGTSLLFLTLIHDFVIVSGNIRGADWFSVGLFLFVMAQAFVLSFRFSGLSKSNKQLLKELDFQNKNLETIVEERTRELVNQKTLLIEANQELQDQKESMLAQSEMLEDINDLLEKEKEKTDKLLLNVLPENIAEELKLHGRSFTHSYPMVSVMFVDFVGFSEVAEKIDPGLLLQDLHYYFANFDDVIKKYNLEKIKTIGDAYMCAGGLHENAGENHVAATVMAALEIRDFIEANKEDRLFAGEKGLDCRVGINTGPVVAGVVGNIKFAFDIWGPAVNIAKRMEGSCEPGKVNISEYTHNYIHEKFLCVSRGYITIKHRKTMQMFYVEGVYKPKE
ncbi:MAG: adenylate/guanylate cyclase domain-containing protein [Bacteroidales bacterium]